MYTFIVITKASANSFFSEMLMVIAFLKITSNVLVFVNRLISELFGKQKLLMTTLLYYLRKFFKIFFLFCTLVYYRIIFKSNKFFHLLLLLFSKLVSQIFSACSASILPLLPTHKNPPQQSFDE